MPTYETVGGDGSNVAAYAKRKFEKWLLENREKLANSLDKLSQICDEWNGERDPSIERRVKETFREIERILVNEHIQHVCGATGFNPMLGDYCEKCENERRSYEISK